MAGRWALHVVRHSMAAIIHGVKTLENDPIVFTVTCSALMSMQLLDTTVSALG